MAIITTGNRASLTVQEHRQQTAALMPATSGLQVSGGVQSGLDISKTFGMEFMLSAGRAVVPSEDPTQGPAVVTFTSEELARFDDGYPSLDRIDVVALKVDESDLTQTPTRIVVIKGQPAANELAMPVRPALPAGHEALFAVPILAGTSDEAAGWDPGLAVDIRKHLHVSPSLAGSSGNSAWAPVPLDATWTGTLQARRIAGGELAHVRGTVTWADQATPPTGPRQQLGKLPWAGTGGINPPNEFTAWSLSSNGTTDLKPRVHLDTGGVLAADYDTTDAAHVSDHFTLTVDTLFPIT